MSKLLTITLIALSVLSAAASPMWGPEGHCIVANIAVGLMDANTAQQANNLLQGTSFCDASHWADQIKRTSGWTWSAVLHYINTPDWACNFDPSRDCSDSRCVYGAILNFTQVLATSSDATVQNEALKFLIHFIGDIHQPLHVGFTSDEGGNKIHVGFMTHQAQSLNLHEVWDKYIIELRMRNDFNNDQDTYAQYLLQQVQSGSYSGSAQKWASCASGDGNNYACPNQWASESVGLACKYAYTDANGDHITDGENLQIDYYNYVVGVVDQQLARAGVRLAATLQRVFAANNNLSALPSNRL